MSEANHSPLPWRACGQDRPAPCKCLMLWSPAADHCVLQLHVPECERYDDGDAAPPAEVAAANLRLVLMAVNSYHESLQALRVAASFIRMNEPYAVEVIRQLEEAVAKATADPWAAAPKSSD